MILTSIPKEFQEIMKSKINELCTRLYKNCLDFAKHIFSDIASDNHRYILDVFNLTIQSLSQNIRIELNKNYQMALQKKNLSSQFLHEKKSQQQIQNQKPLLKNQQSVQQLGMQSFLFFEQDHIDFNNQGLQQLLSQINNQIVDQGSNDNEYTSIDTFKILNKINQLVKLQKYSGNDFTQFLQGLKADILYPYYDPQTNQFHKVNLSRSTNIKDQQIKEPLKNQYQQQQLFRQTEQKAQQRFYQNTQQQKIRMKKYKLLFFTQIIDKKKSIQNTLSKSQLKIISKYFKKKLQYKQLLLKKNQSELKNISQQLKNFKKAASEILKIQSSSRLLKALWFVGMKEKKIKQKVMKIPQGQMNDFKAEVDDMKEFINKRCFCWELIDAKWPYLNNITLRQCSNITADIFSICKFKGLMKIQVDQQIFNGNNARHYLLSRGLKININQQKVSISGSPIFLYQNISKKPIFDFLYISKKIPKNQQTQSEQKQSEQTQSLSEELNLKKQKKLKLITILCKTHSFPNNNKKEHKLSNQQVGSHQINQICIEDKCIQNNQFLLCPKCYHQQDHQKINFNKLSLEFYFDSLEVNHKNNEKTKISELTTKYKKQIQIFQQYLNIFDIDNNKMAKKIQNLLEKGDRKDIFSLKSIKKLNTNLKDMDQQSKIKYINTIQQTIFGQIQYSLTKNLEQLKRIAKNVNKCFQLTLEQLQNRIPYVNPALTNMQEQQSFRDNPFSKIVQNQQKNNQQIICENYLKDNQFQIQKEIKNLIKKELSNDNNRQLSKTQKQKIYQIFTKQKHIDNIQFKDDEPSLKNIYYQLKKRIQLFSIISWQYYPIFYIIHKNINNLRQINICYTLNHQLDYKYSISSFKLFEAVSFNPNLSFIFIEGVEVKYINSFIKYLIVNKDEIQYTNKEQQLKKYLQSSQEGNKYFLQMKFKQQKNWIQNLDLENITISINASLAIKHEQSYYSTSQKFQHFIQFLSLFKQIRGFQLILDINSIGFLDQTILKLLKFIKKSTISITSSQKLKQSVQLSLLIKLFKLFIHNHRFISIKSIKLEKLRLENIKELLNNFFTVNNIKYLKMDNCINFPHFQQLTSIPIIYLGQTNQKSLQNVGVNEKVDDLFFVSQEKLHIDNSCIDKFDIIKNYLSSMILLEEKLGKRHIKISLNQIQRLPKIAYIYLQDMELDVSFLQIQTQILIFTPLRQLHLINCYPLTNSIMKYIDNKFPNIKILSIRNKDRIDENVFNGCQLKQLLQLNISQYDFIDDRFLQKLKKRGVYINLNQNILQL